MKGRMPREIVFVWLTLAGILVFPRPVQADPHAMFYTAIGQRQLFFNVLAALNQADYVEPPTGNFSREELLKLREAAGLPPETNSVLKSTKTDLASVITRGVTLEGQDLWTAYQRFQLALEAARRNSTNELARKFCQHAFGILGCDPSNFKNRQQDKAIERDAIKERSDAFFNRGIQAAFSSGSSEGVYGNDQEQRKVIAQDKKAPKQFYAYDASVDLWRQRAEGNEAEQSIIDSLLARSEQVFLPAAIDPHVFDGIQMDENGNPKLAFSPSSQGILAAALGASSAESGHRFTQSYLQTINGLLSLPTAILAVGEQAANRAMLSQSADIDGFKAHRTYEPETLPGGDYGEIKANVLIPAEARKADVQALKNLSVEVGSNQAYAPADAINNPGSTQFIERGGSGKAAGAFTTKDFSTEDLNTAIKELEAMRQKVDAGEVPQGEVKGIFSDILMALLLALFQKYDEPKPDFQFNPNPIAAHDEEGLRAALTAADPGFNPKEARSSGFGDFVDALWETFCSIIPICNS